MTRALSRSPGRKLVTGAARPPSRQPPPPPPPAPAPAPATATATDQATDDPDAGFVGGLWGWVFGLLIFVVGTLMVARAWAVVDTKFAVDAAARQAVRTYVEAPAATDAGPEATAAADAALSGFDRPTGPLDVRLVSGRWARCSRVSIEATYPSPWVALPWLGRVGTAGRVAATSSELVDPFRAGLPGTSTCA